MSWVKKKWSQNSFSSAPTPAINNDWSLKMMGRVMMMIDDCGVGDGNGAGHGGNDTDGSGGSRGGCVGGCGGDLHDGLFTSVMMVVIKVVKTVA